MTFPGPSCGVNGSNTCQSLVQYPVNILAFLREMVMRENLWKKASILHKSPRLSVGTGQNQARYTLGKWFFWFSIEEPYMEHIISA